MGDNRPKKSNEKDEVEQLLRETQDDILLKFTINSHTTSSAIDPDLDRRFNALKSNNKTVDPTTKRTTITTAKITAAGIGNTSSDDDLFGRFSALKNSNKSSGSGQDSFVEKQLKLKEFDVDGDNNDDDDDEVEKLMKWAIDAARLDPSPPSDDDEDDDDEDEDEYSDDSDDGNDSGNKFKKK